MNRVQQNDVDAALTGFFKSQMPSPWPKANVAPATTLSARAPRVGGSLTHARLVLAASVLFLVFGFLGLSKQFRTEPEVVTAVEQIANKPGPNGVNRSTPKVQKNKELPR
ncbi:MAG: hypothetical protein U0744_02750 [Gemmataceae bacterium]